MCTCALIFYIDTHTHTYTHTRNINTFTPRRSTSVQHEELVVRVSELLVREFGGPVEGECVCVCEFIIVKKQRFIHTTLHFTTLHCASLCFTSLHFTSPHFTTPYHNCATPGDDSKNKNTKQTKLARTASLSNGAQDNKDGGRYMCVLVCVLLCVCVRM
jgi:hypothetical protein